MPALSALCASPCGRYLYQLSSEADCVHVRHTVTGELLYAAPVGVFPRMMRLHPSGRALLVAGGAVSEAYVLHAPELTRESVIYTRGADVYKRQGQTGASCASAARPAPYHPDIPEANVPAQCWRM